MTDDRSLMTLGGGAGNPLSAPDPIELSSVSDNVLSILGNPLGLAAVASLAGQIQQLRPAFLNLFGSASDRGGDEDIYTMNADGSGAVNLASATGFDGTPEWSHDGKWIVFHSRRDGGEAEIYVMRADGSGLRRLTNNNAADVYPAFSPNGKKIVFQSNRDGYKDLYIMNADGSEQRRLIMPAPVVTPVS